MFVHLAAAAESVWLRSWNHIYCSEMCKWCCESISVCPEMHSAMPYLHFNTTLTFACKSCIFGHANWRSFFFFWCYCNTRRTTCCSAKNKSWSSSCWIFHHVPTFHYPYKSPSVLTSRYAQWVNRRSSGGRRGSERLGALGLVCAQRFTSFFSPPTYSWGSISVHFY